MEEIIKLLKSSTPQRAITLLTASEKNYSDIERLRKEYHEVNRNLRRTQIGHVQKDKKIKGERKEAVRIPIPLQNRIVTTATAFEVGEPVTIVPTTFTSKGEKSTEKNALAREIERLMKVNRLDSKLQQAKHLQKSETQAAILFYIQDLEPNNLINRMLGVNKNKEIKSKILESKNGRMAPYFDAFGDMKAFLWQFDTIENQRTVQNTWIYTDTEVYRFSNASGNMTLVDGEPQKHGFSKIPIVYFSQDYPEWHIAQPMIDRLEVAMSKLGASNDYSGHPILMLYGEVQGAPDKDEDGKAFRFNMVKDEDSGKVEHGDAKFLTHEGAPEAVRMELDRLEKYIYSLTSTPDISFENIKGLGAISGIAIKLMFLDAIMKAKLNEGQNRTAVERMLSVMISGIITTTITSLKSEASNTYFDIEFNSILPDDIKSSVETYSLAVQTGIMSVETAVANLDMTPDQEKELENIRNNQAERAPKPDGEIIRPTRLNNDETQGV